MVPKKKHIREAREEDGLAEGGERNAESREKTYSRRRENIEERDKDVIENVQQRAERGT
jgi:hypothetical protein